MFKYLKHFDTFMKFDETNKTVLSVTNNLSVNIVSFVYMTDERTFDAMYNSAINNMNGNGTPGPNTTGWGEITEEMFNQVKTDTLQYINQNF